MALLAAKARTVKAVKAQHPEWNEATIAGMLVAYTSGKVLERVDRSHWFVTPTTPERLGGCGFLVEIYVD